MRIGMWHLGDDGRTAELGAELASRLGVGDTVLLSGDPGAGKSALARAILRSWTSDPRLEVPSPTYTLVQTYRTARGEAWHADLYRLGHSSEVAELGLPDAIGRVLCLIEWPELLSPAQSAGALRLHLAAPALSADIGRAPGTDPGSHDALDHRILTAEGPEVWAHRLRDLADWGRCNNETGPSNEGPLVRSGQRARREGEPPDADMASHRSTPVGADQAGDDAGGGSRSSAGLDPDLISFLARSPAAGWHIQAVAGDASARRYLRLTGPDGGTLILMDSRADADSLDPFLRIAGHLRAHGFVAPQPVMREGAIAIVDDLGPETLATAIDRHDRLLRPSFEAVVDALADLADVPVPEGLPVHSPDRAVALLEPLHAEISRPDREHLDAVLHDALSLLGGPPDRLSLRDLHAGNLIWRPALSGRDRIGFLDVQDAHAAPLAYDLASLLYDARRNLPDDLRSALVTRFAERRGLNARGLDLAASVHATQRNLRILGLFTRFARQGRAAYATHIPRVRAHIRTALRDPKLAGLRAAVTPWVDQP